jgi:hypothetical protein
MNMPTPTFIILISPNATQSIDIASSTIPSRKNINIDHTMNDNQKNDTPIDDSNHQLAYESASVSWYPPPGTPSPADPDAAATSPGTAERGAPEGFERYSTREPPLRQIPRTLRARTVGSTSTQDPIAGLGSSTEAVLGARFGSYRPHVLEISSPESIEDTPMSDSPRSQPRSPTPDFFASAEPTNTADPPTSAEDTIPDDFMQLTLDGEGIAIPTERLWRIVTRRQLQARQQKDATKEVPRRISLPDTPRLQTENDPAMGGPSSAGAPITTGLDSQTGVAIMDFAMAPGSRVPLDQVAKAAMVAARVNEQFEIKRAIETRSMFSTTPEQFARITSGMNEHSEIQNSAGGFQLPLTMDQATIDQLAREAELTMGREEDISPRTSIEESQPSTSVPPLSSRAANSGGIRPTLRNAFICELCNQPGHRWLNCIHTCKRCGQMHKGYLTCTSQDKKRKDEGEGEDKAGSKRMRRRGAISE